jgi:hypothetical protein
LEGREVASTAEQYWQLAQECQRIASTVLRHCRAKALAVTACSSSQEATDVIPNREGSGSAVTAFAAGNIAGIVETAGGSFTNSGNVTGGNGGNGTSNGILNTGGAFFGNGGAGGAGVNFAAQVGYCHAAPSLPGAKRRIAFSCRMVAFGAKERAEQRIRAKRTCAADQR